MNKNSFAVTPPMGWNSYDYYDTTVTEEAIRANARYMAENLKEYGWEYVVVDIQWYAKKAGSLRDRFQYIPFSTLEIDAYGRLVPDVDRFPSSKDGKGFGPLAEYVHSLGLKFGIHIMRGIPRVAAQNHMPVLGASETADMIADPSSICGWNPDMYGVRDTADGQAYYDSILQLYADWGVDFIKCDDICDSWMHPGPNFAGWYETRMLHKAIMKTGRSIVLSLSPGPAHVDKATHYCDNANMWRITDDFWDNWKLLKEMFWRCEQWQDHVDAGCFPDCDMLPLGKLGAGFGHERDSRFTYEEKKTMMTLWCMFRSPLMLGAEMTKLPKEEYGLLTNQAMLNCMKEGRHGTQIERTEDFAIWSSALNQSSELKIALFNLSDEDRELSVKVSDITEKIGYTGKVTTAWTELWGGETTDSRDGRIVVTVPAHGVRVFGE